MMVGPHIRAGLPDTRSIMARTFFASSRRCGSGTASIKSSTLTSVGFVFRSAIPCPFRDPLPALVGPADRVAAIPRRDRRDQAVAVATIQDSLREIMRHVLESGAGAVRCGQPEPDGRTAARARPIDRNAVGAGLETDILIFPQALALPRPAEAQHHAAARRDPDFLRPALALPR